MAFVISNLTGFETGNDQEAVAVSGTLSYVGGGTQRTGSFALQLDVDSEDFHLLLDPAGLKTNPNYFVVGLYVKLVDATPSGDGTLIIFSVDGGDAHACHVGVDSSGNLYVVDDTSTKQATGTFVLQDNTWTKIEIRFLAHGSAGYLTVYVNDNSTPDVSMTGVDTQTGGINADVVRLKNPHSSTSIVYYDDVYVKSDTADGSVSDCIGAGDGLDWEVPGYYQSSGTGMSSQGTSPAAGALADAGENPLNDTNEIEWTGSSDDADWAADGTVRAGPNTDITGTVLAGKYWYRVDRDGGGSTTHYLQTGNYDGTTWAHTENAETDIPQGAVEYWYIETSNMPSATDEDMAFGIRIDGARDLHIFEVGGWILQTVTAGAEYTQAAVGALTFGSGAITKKPLKQVAGILTFATGALARKILFNIAGILTFVGNAAKKMFQNAEGALTFSGVLVGIKKVFKSIAGVLTFSGDVAKKSLKPIDGSLTFASGNIVKKAKKATAGTLILAGGLVGKARKAIAGALTFVGTVTGLRTAFISISGALTFVGSIAKKTAKSSAGSLSLAGAVDKKMFQVVAGAVSFSGDMAKKTSIGTAGALTFTGSLINKTLKAVAGALTFIGALATVFQSGGAGIEYQQAVVGILSLSGDIAKKTAISPSGAVTFVGGLVSKALKAVSGALTFVGNAAGLRTAFLSILGDLTFTGDIVKKTEKSLAGDLTFGRSLVRKVSVTLAGILTFVGNGAKKIFQDADGGLTFAGAIALKTKKSLAGTLSFAGANTYKISKQVAGILTFVGAAAKKTSVSWAGTVTFAGDITKKTLKELAGVLTFQGSLLGIIVYIWKLLFTKKRRTMFIVRPRQTVFYTEPREQILSVGSRVVVFSVKSRQLIFK